MSNILLGLFHTCNRPSCAHSVDTERKTGGFERRNVLQASNLFSGFWKSWREAPVAHLAGIAQALFWDVTVVHCISAHNSHELHLQQQIMKIKHTARGCKSGSDQLFCPNITKNYQLFQDRLVHAKLNILTIVYHKELCLSSAVRAGVHPEQVASPSQQSENNPPPLIPQQTIIRVARPVIPGSYCSRVRCYNWSLWSECSSCSSSLLLWHIPETQTETAQASFHLSLNVFEKRKKKDHRLKYCSGEGVSFDWKLDVIKRFL